LALLDRAIDRLTRHQRDAVVAHYLHGQPVAEIAARLAVAPTAVHERLRSGVAAMRRFFARHGREAGLPAALMAVHPDALDPVPAGSFREPSANARALSVTGTRIPVGFSALAAVLVAGLLGIGLAVAPRPAGGDDPVHDGPGADILDQPTTVAFAWDDAEEAAVLLARHHGLAVRIPPGGSRLGSVRWLPPAGARVRDALDAICTDNGLAWTWDGDAVAFHARDGETPSERVQGDGVAAAVRRLRSPDGDEAFARTAWVRMGMEPAAWRRWTAAALDDRRGDMAGAMLTAVPWDPVWIPPPRMDADRAEAPHGLRRPAMTGLGLADGALIAMDPTRPDAVRLLAAAVLAGSGGTRSADAVAGLLATPPAWSGETPGTPTLPRLFPGSGVTIPVPFVNKQPTPVGWPATVPITALAAAEHLAWMGDDRGTALLAQVAGREDGWRRPRIALGRLPGDPAARLALHGPEVLWWNSDPRSGAALASALATATDAAVAESVAVVMARRGDGATPDVDRWLVQGPSTACAWILSDKGEAGVQRMLTAADAGSAVAILVGRVLAAADGPGQRPAVLAALAATGAHPARRFAAAAAAGWRDGSGIHPLHTAIAEQEASGDGSAAADLWAAALGSRHPGLTRAALDRFAGKPAWRPRILAGWAWSRDPAVAERLRGHLERGDLGPTLERRILAEMPGRQWPWIAPVLADFIKDADRDPAARREALRLGVAGGTVFAEAYAQATRDPDPGIRVRGLYYGMVMNRERLWTPEDQSRLRADPDPQVRSYALAFTSLDGPGLGRSADRTTELAALGDPDPGVRATAATILAQTCLVESRHGYMHSTAVRAAVDAAVAREQDPGVRSILTDLQQERSPKVHRLGGNEDAPLHWKVIGGWDVKRRSWRTVDIQVHAPAEPTMGGGFPVPVSGG
ncbi:MAG: hypothetical protein RLZZ127_3143, partial [Planctomycetota bacterium]